MTNKIHTHQMLLTHKVNGGEGLYLETDFFDNGTGEIFTNQRLILQSYCNNASINLFGASLEPETMIKIAMEMKEQMSIAKEKIKHND